MSRFLGIYSHLFVKSKLRRSHYKLRRGPLSERETGAAVLLRTWRTVVLLSILPEKTV